MANFIYKKAKQALLNGDIAVDTNDLKVLLVNTATYTSNQNSDEFVSDIAASAIKARSNALANKSTTNGVLDANDVQYEGYSGAAFDAIILYQVGTSDADSRLIFYIDTSDGLPFEGANNSLGVTINWSNDSSKILSI
jgi:hypothetical protein